MKTILACFVLIGALIPPKMMAQANDTPKPEIIGKTLFRPQMMNSVARFLRMGRPSITTSPSRHTISMSCVSRI